MTWIVADGMAKILEFTRSGHAFDAQVTEVLVEAYERAVAASDGAGLSGTVREIIARRIIAAARRGETNPDLLCQVALATLSRMGAEHKNRPFVRHHVVCSPS
jgi:hypothetical protein